MMRAINDGFPAKLWVDDSLKLTSQPAVGLGTQHLVFVCYTYTYIRVRTLLPIYFFLSPAAEITEKAKQ